MKRKILISLLLVLVLCASIALAACKVKADILEKMLADLIDTYPATAQVTESFKRSTDRTYIADDGKITEVKVAWEIEGSSAITISDADDNGDVTINVPGVRDNEIKFTLAGTLTNAKGKPFKTKGGDTYTAKFQFTAPKTNASQNVGEAFRQTIVKNPTADTPYVWGTYWGHEMYYFAGTTVSEKTTYRYTTTANYADAVPVYVEAVTGGYRLYFMKDNVKTYINLTTFDNTSYVSVSTGFETDAAKLDGVLTIDEEIGALKCTTLTYNNNTYPGYFGMRAQYHGEICACDAGYLNKEAGEANSWKTNAPPIYLLSGETVLPDVPALTEVQILEQAFALGANEEMPGVITLTGVITSVGTVNNNYGTFELLVGDKTIECYKMSNSAVYVNTLKVGDKITVRGVLRNYTKDTTNKVEFDEGATFVLVEAAPDAPITKPDDLAHAGTAADPYSVADADKYAKVLGSNKTEDVVYVTGIVADLKAPSQGEYNFNIVDAAGDTVKCIIYWTTSTQAPVNGDVVVVKGYLTQYNGSAEIAKKDNNNKPVIVSINGTELGGETPTPTPSTTEHEGTEADPYSVADARTIILALEGAASSTTVYNDKPVYVKGYVVSISAQNNFDIADTKGGTTTLQFYYGALDEGLTKTIYINDEVVLYGYLANYSKGYKCELAKTNDVTPLVKTITTADSTIKASTENVNSTITFTEPTAVEGVVTAANGTSVKFTIAAAAGYEVQTVKVGKDTLNDESGVYTVVLNGDMVIEVAVKEEGSKTQVMTIDLSSSANSNITITNKNDMSKDPLETTIDGIKYAYCTAYQNSGYLMLASKDNSTARAYFLNKDAIPGKITKIVITTGSSASANAEYRVVMSSTPITDRQTTGGVVVKGVGELEAVIATAEDGYSYFCITVGNNYNGQIVSIDITYEAE